MAQNLIYHRGDVLNFTAGEYSDFHNAGFVVVVEPDLDLPMLVQRFIAGKARRYGTDEFPSWLIAQGYCLPLENQEVWLGGYGEFDDEFVPRKGV